MSGQQSIVLLLNIHLGQQQGDNQAEDHGNPEVHEVQHVQSGSRLHCCGIDVSAGIQQDTGDGSTETAANLDTLRGAGVHGAVDTLAGLQVGILRASSDQRVQVALHGAHADVAQSGEDQHHGNIAQVAADDDQHAAGSCEAVANQIDLVHTIHLLDNGRSNQKTNDHGDVGEGSEVPSRFASPMT